MKLFSEAGLPATYVALPFADWRTRSDWPAVALANKNARIAWALLTREKGFDAKHVCLKVAA